MTSRVSCFKMIRNGMKRRLWYGAICFLLFFIAFPLSEMLRFESVEQIKRQLVDKNGQIVRIERMREEFQIFVGGGDYLVMFFVALAALLGAWCGLSWLHSRKKMDMMGSLPVRREKILLTEALSILILFFGSYLINLLLAVLIGGAKGIMTGKAAALGLAAVGIHLLYFCALYLCAAIVMLLTGKILTGILGTLTILGIAPITYGIVSTYPELFLQTYISDVSVFERVVKYTSLPGSFVMVTQRIGRSNGMLSAVWIPLLIAAAIGSGLALLAVWLIKHRPAEGAEQALVFPKLEGIIKAVILYPLALGGGLFFRELGYGGEREQQLWLWFGICFVGFLISILIEVIYHMDRKQLFEHKGWTAATGAATLLTAAVFVFDLTGYDTWLPERENLEHAVICGERIWHTYEDGSKDTLEYLENHLDEFDPEIAYEVGKAGVAALTEEGDMRSVNVIYQLKNGTVKKRSYQVPLDVLQKAERKLYEKPIYKETVFPILVEEIGNIGGVTLEMNERAEFLNLNNQEEEELAKRYREDLLTLGYDEINEEGNMRLQFHDKSGFPLSSWRDPLLNKNYKRTMEFLKEKGYFAG